jgi:hypothetical protein
LPLQGRQQRRIDPFEFSGHPEQHHVFRRAVAGKRVHASIARLRLGGEREGVDQRLSGQDREAAVFVIRPVAFGAIRLGRTEREPGRARRHDDVAADRDGRQELVGARKAQGARRGQQRQHDLALEVDHVCGSVEAEVAAQVQRVAVVDKVMRGFRRQGESAAAIGRREIRQQAEFVELVPHLAVLPGSIRDDGKTAGGRRGTFR